MAEDKESALRRIIKALAKKPGSAPKDTKPMTTFWNNQKRKKGGK